MAKTGIFKTVNGQQVELSAKEVKNFIMKVNNWTSEEYDKKRFIVKNKLRTYEAFTGEAPQSPVEFLYREAKAKKRYGEDYQPSMKHEQIMGFQSYGSQKAIQKAMQSQKISTKWTQEYNAYVKERFKEFIEKNPKAKEISDAIADPVKREQALSKYADKVHLKIEADLRVAKQQNQPFGEVAGSDITLDFDYSNFL